MLRYILPFLLLTALGARAQTPSSHVFVVDMHREQGNWVFSDPQRISIHSGYNNQPAFTLDGRSVLFVTDSTGATMDIYRYEFALDTLIQVTHTPEIGEFSPTPVSYDRFLSVVVEPDKRQRIWQYNLETGGSSLFLAERDSVGYFEILNDTDVAMFVLGSPATLRIYNRETHTQRIIEGIPGRCIQKIPGLGEFSYVDKSRPDRWVLVSVDPVTGSRIPIVQMPDGTEDYAWSPDGELFAAKGSVLYVYSDEAGGIWKTALDFRHYGMANITRMAISPDGAKIALVSPFVPVAPPVE